MPKSTPRTTPRTTARRGLLAAVGTLAAAGLVIKAPGESDGNCGTGAGSSAGQFLPQVAYDLIYGY